MPYKCLFGGWWWQERLLENGEFMSSNETNSGTSGRIRFLSGLTGLFFVCLAIFLSRGIVNWGVSIMSVALTTSPAFAAILLIWYSIRCHIKKEAKIIQSGWKWGAIVGVAGLGVGVVIIPLIESTIQGRDLPQAPLLGIFITGPSGFSVGIIIGILIGVYRQITGLRIADSSTQDTDKLI